MLQLDGVFQSPSPQIQLTDAKAMGAPDKNQQRTIASNVTIELIYFGGLSPEKNMLK